MANTEMQRRPSGHFVARLIAAGCGAGYSPRAPGTVGSAGACVIGFGLLLIGLWALALGVLAALVAGFWAIEHLAIDDDPGWVVIDEVAGQWIALLAAPPASVPGVVAAFVLFRAFDITKPGPVHRAERAPGAAGIIADDVLAGIFAGVVLLAARLAFPQFL